MKGDDKLLSVLKELLDDEKAAISRYMINSKMCANWGYKKLQNAIEKQAREEMHHAEWIIQQILFLEGMGSVSMLNALKIGESMLEMLTSAHEAELSAIRAYNRAIELSREINDQATETLLGEIDGGVMPDPEPPSPAGFFSPARL